MVDVLALMTLVALCVGGWVAFDQYYRRPGRDKEALVKSFAAWLETVKASDFDRFNGSRK